MEQLLISKSDFDGIRQVSKHCSFDKLEDYIRERQFLDLASLLGEAFYYDVVKTACDGLIDDLLDGSEYTDCDGNTRYHYGIRRALVHFAYAAFVVESSYVSTPHGMVQKTSQDSMPVQMSELRNLHDRNRRIAQDYMEGVMDYICHTKDETTFLLYKKGCGCKCDDSPKRVTRGTSFSFITGAAVEDFNDCDTCKDD